MTSRLNPWPVSYVTNRARSRFSGPERVAPLFCEKMRQVRYASTESEANVAGRQQLAFAVRVATKIGNFVDLGIEFRLPASFDNSSSTKTPNQRATAYPLAVRTAGPGPQYASGHHFLEFSAGDASRCQVGGCSGTVSVSHWRDEDFDDDTSTLGAKD